MPNTYETYGTRSSDLHQVKAQLERALGLEFELHESMYWGGEYYMASSATLSKITIRCNHNAYTGQLTEPDFRDFHILIAVVKTESDHELEAVLMAASVTLLRREQA